MFVKIQKAYKEQQVSPHRAAILRQSRNAAAYCDTAVAAAAPTTPQRKTMINTGSRMMFKTLASVKAPRGDLVSRAPHHDIRMGVLL